MAVTRDDVLHVAGLARLRLEEREAEGLTADLDEILRHMEALSGVPVEPGGEAEAAPVRRDPAPLREDGRARPDVLLRPPSELAPEWEEGFFLVPRLPGMEGADEGAGEA